MVSILDRTLIIDLCIRFIHNYYWFKCGALLYLTGGSDKTRIQINNTPHLSVCTLTIHQQTSDECLY